MAKFYSTIMKQNISPRFEHHSKRALGHTESYHDRKLTSMKNVMLLFYGLQEILCHCTKDRALENNEKDRNAIIIEQF